MIFRRDTIPTFFRAVCRFVREMLHGEQVIATPDVAWARRVRCRTQCDQYAKASDQCMVCTCDIELKTMIATESCPRARWKAQTRFSRGL